MENGNNTNQRILCIVDVQELYYGAREMYGRDYRVDYHDLKLDIAEDQGVEVEDLLLHAFVIINPAYDATRFVGMLLAEGYAVQKKFVTQDKALGPMPTNWNVGMAVTAMSHIDDADVLVLVGGNNDLVPVVKAFKNAGKRVLTYSFSSSTSATLLQRNADRAYLINKQTVYDLAEEVTGDEEENSDGPATSNNSSYRNESNNSVAQENA